MYTVFCIRLAKETVRAALNGPDEPEEMEQVEAEVDDKDSESDNDFGFKAPKKPVSKAAARTRPSIAPVKPVETPAPAPAVCSGSEKADSNSKKIEKGHGVLLGLDTFSPLAFWQGSAKAADWEKRVEKALALVPALESLQEGQLAKDLQERADKIISIMEDMSNLRDAETSKFASGLFSESPEYIMRLLKLPADCLATILTDCGRKLLEARLCWGFCHQWQLIITYIHTPSYNYRGPWTVTLNHHHHQ